MCVTACPVRIDTGKVMKTFRAAARPAPVQAAGAAAARAWGPTTAALRGALTVAEAVPGPVLRGLSAGVRKVAGETVRDWVPQVGDLPGAGTARAALAAHSPAVVPPEQAPGAAQAVYFPACIGSLFAAEGDGAGVAVAFLRLCARAGVRVVVPAGIDGLCCATVWESKGLVDGATVMARKVAAAVWQASDGGRLPVVCDATSCTHGLTGIRARLGEEDARRWDRLTLLDAVTFARATLLPRLALRPLPSLALHPTCSAVHLGAVGDLTVLARAVAREVTVPDTWGCCGTAGDRGMLHPELTASATAAQAAELAARERRGGTFGAYASCNRTCEMGMTAATGRPYRHILEILEEASRGRPLAPPPRA